LITKNQRREGERRFSPGFRGFLKRQGRRGDIVKKGGVCKKRYYREK
jgi:hypothetical protein